jgi:hypothetical protein
LKSSALICISLLLMVIVLPSITGSNNNSSQEHETFYAEGEELLYKVSWSGIKIGTIRLKVMPDEGGNDVRHRATATIDSYAGLPFVNVHLVAFTEMDSGFNSLSSFSLEKRDDDWRRLMYHYTLSEKKVYVEEAFQNDRDSHPHDALVRDTIHLTRIPIQDGISLIFIARHLLRVRKLFSYPTLSNEKLGETFIYPSRPQSKVNIDAWNKPIPVVELSGKMKLEGIFGLSGDFKGWFSDDSEAVPITAEMKVILGSVKIELMQWNRKGWKPPE